MEMEAHNRDQTAWACAAQDSRLLPKKPGTKKQAGQKIKQMVMPQFEEFYRNNPHLRKHSE